MHLTWPSKVPFLQYICEKFEFREGQLPHSWWRETLDCRVCSDAHRKPPLPKLSAYSAAHSSRLWFSAVLFLLLWLVQSWLWAWSLVSQQGSPFVPSLFAESSGYINIKLHVTHPQGDIQSVLGSDWSNLKLVKKHQGKSWPNAPELWGGSFGF